MKPTDAKQRLTKYGRYRVQRDRSTIYPAKVMEKARRLWLLGYTYSAISRIKDMPNNKKTYSKWRTKFDWDKDLDGIKERTREKRIENISTELAKLDSDQLAILKKMRKQIGKHLEMEAMLEARDIQSLSIALDKAIKNERLIVGQATERQQTEVSGKVGWEELIYGTANVDPPPKPERNPEDDSEITEEPDTV